MNMNKRKGTEFQKRESQEEPFTIFHPPNKKKQCIYTDNKRNDYCMLFASKKGDELYEKSIQFRHFHQMESLKWFQLFIVVEVI